MRSTSLFHSFYYDKHLLLFFLSVKIKNSSTLLFPESVKIETYLKYDIDCATLIEVKVLLRWERRMGGKS